LNFLSQTPNIFKKNKNEKTILKKENYYFLSKPWFFCGWLGVFLRAIFLKIANK